MKTATTDREAPKVDLISSPGYRRFWISLILVLVLDQLSKWAIARFSGFTVGLYPPFGGYEIIPGFFNLVYATNHGAAWGILEGYSWMLISLALLVLGLIAGFRRELGLYVPAYQWCFGMISGGILGNTLDRVCRGQVIDFLDFHIPWYRWPTFNIADSAIVVGTFLYVFLQVRKSGAHNRQNP